MAPESSQPTPPRAIESWLARRLRATADARFVIGDLREEYAQRCGRSSSRLAAGLWYVAQALVLGLGQGARPLRRSPPFRPIATTVRELRLALRRLIRTPPYTVTVVANLVLGVAAVTGLFVVLHDVVLAPLPYPESDRLVVIEHEMPGIPIQGQPTRFGAFQGLAGLYRERSRQIETIGVYGTFDAAIRDDGPAYVRIGYASAGFFAALGRPAAEGSLPTSPERPAAGEQASVLSYALWRDRYDSDPRIVGSSLRVEGFERRIAGVMPSGEVFPSPAVALWNPRPAATVEANPEWLVDGLVARVSPDATPESVRAELDGLIAELPGRTDNDFVRRAVDEGHLRSRVTSMHDYVVGDVSRSLWLMFAGALLVLVAALFNVTNLTIVHARSQRTEMAVRRALGAGTPHLLVHRMADGLVLALAAGGLGYGAALGAIGLLRRLAPRGLPRLDEIAVGSDGVLVVAALTLVAAGWLGLILVAAARHATLRVGSSSRGETPRGRLLRDGLTAGQLAVAVVLLVAAGLLLRGFLVLSHVDPGFDPGEVLAFRVPFPFQEIQDAGAAGGVATPFYDELAERIRALPGVVAAGYGRCAPFSEACQLQGLTLRRVDAPDAGGPQSLSGIAQIAPGYVDALGIRLLRGRDLEVRDHQERTNAILVSEGLAEHLWPSEDPLGKRIFTPDLAGWSPFTVVGVVADARHTDLRGDPEPVAYLPVLTREQEYELWTTTFLVRSDGDPLALVPALRGILHELRPDIPMAGVGTLSDRLRQATSGIRLGTILLAFCAGATLLLGALGVYGLMTYSVLLRRREFGVRMAVGASAARVRRSVVGHAALVSLAGVAVGVALAIAGSRLFESSLDGIPALDPTIVAGALALLVSVALAAAALPAHRAARTDPSSVLRTEA